MDGIVNYLWIKVRKILSQLKQKFIKKQKDEHQRKEVGEPLLVHREHQEAGEPLFVRCGCERPICALSCERGALVSLRGDLLVEIHKCPGCVSYRETGLPECIAACSCSDDKAILAVASPEEKRTLAAHTMVYTSGM